MERITSRQNPLVARFRAAARGDADGLDAARRRASGPRKRWRPACQLDVAALGRRGSPTVTLAIAASDARGAQVIVVSPIR